MKYALVVLAMTMLTSLAAAQQWTDRVRGSWIAGPNDTNGNITLVGGDDVCEIAVADSENSAVKQAAVFLAGDIEKISGKRPRIVKEWRDDRPVIVFTTTGKTPAESYRIESNKKAVWCYGGDFRGTAFAAYTLAERLGVDPLYHWTGYEPEHHNPLTIKHVEFEAGPPTFRYRGMFHDDEDILPRPFENSGYPLRTGDVPNEWYAKYFETALRLRMNMVAPYTRVHRRYEVQKMASDWGLFYTSHHYDILLSNPYGIERYGLAKARGVSGAWDWINNRDGMLRYWRGGVEENKDLDCIWPVGMRGTDDTGYKFPPGTSDVEQAKAFRDAIEQQVAMTRQLVPKDKQPPLFHFTLYTEMLPKYQAGNLEVPDDVIIVWPDDNDGTMRGLPTKTDRWKHGVYYHLAYLGKQVKQNAHVVPPARIADQFRKIVDSGATRYMLVNVSELREFVMETRMLADVCWDAKTALAGDDPARRYVDWWCREYFSAAPTDAAAAYANYYKLFDSYEKQWFGSDALHNLLGGKKQIDGLDGRFKEMAAASKQIDHTLAKLRWPETQFFFEHVVLPTRFDQRPVEAAVALRDGDEAHAMETVEKLETEILRAERPPFEHWYRETWIRREPKQWNVHRPYEEMRMYFATNGKRFELTDPDAGRRRAPTTAASATSAPAAR